MIRLELPGLPANGRLPHRYALCRLHEGRVCHGDNHNPGLRWHDVPASAASLVLLCSDADAPVRTDNINRENRLVAASLPRREFFHWVMIDIPHDCPGIEAASCSDAVTPRGKTDPPGPRGSRQGLNDYTGWFESDQAMRGRYFGYDGPCPPWNDTVLHRYRFLLLAVDVATLPVAANFNGRDVQRAVATHIIEQAQVTATYTLNPGL